MNCIRLAVIRAVNISIAVWFGLELVKLNLTNFFNSFRKYVTMHSRSWRSLIRCRVTSLVLQMVLIIFSLFFITSNVCLSYSVISSGNLNSQLKNSLQVVDQTYIQTLLYLRFSGRNAEMLSNIIKVQMRSIHCC